MSIARRAAVVGVCTAAAMVLFAAPALAHITVTPSSVAAGSTDVLTFHVPNEESKADTVKLDLQIPTDHPIAQLLVQPVPGWTVSVKSITLAKPLVTDDGSFNSAISEVIWSGGKISPGQFQSFTISADPMPTGESQVPFKAIQTYSNGDVVRWIDVQQPGQPAAGHPAPVVTLTATTTTAPISTAPTRAAAAAPASSSDGLSRGLGIAGLVVGLLAVLLALQVARGTRRLVDHFTAPASTPTPAKQAETAVQGTSGSRTSTRRAVPASTKASSRQPQGRRRG